MPKNPEIPVIAQVLNEQCQGHETRKTLFQKLEKNLGRTVVTFFTSFLYPVSIEDADADMLEGLLQKIDLSNGLALMINSPGGYGLAAERIINVCRSYSGTGDFWAIVPGKAKSAATMICFGSCKMMMGPIAELGAIDPQLTLYENDKPSKRFSVYNVVKSYEDLFNRAVKEKGNLQPYLQQLSNYDEREIKEYRSALDLSEDIAIKTLASGMMKGNKEDKIKEDIKIFLTPEKMKVHGRPIYSEEASSCGLNIDTLKIKDKLWPIIYELYFRTNHYVSTMVAKCIESYNYSFTAGNIFDEVKHGKKSQ